MEFYQTGVTHQTCLLASARIKTFHSPRCSSDPHKKIGHFIFKGNCSRLEKIQLPSAKLSGCILRNISKETINALKQQVSHSNSLQESTSTRPLSQTDKRKMVHFESEILIVTLGITDMLN